MGILKSVSSVIGSSKVDNPVRAKLIELNPVNDSIGQSLAFQYFPETITDQRGVDLQSKFGLGSSHPIYQWIHGSPREISFDAVFTSEDAEDPRDPAAVLGDNISNIVRNPINGIISNIVAKSGAGDSVDVAAAIAWLRSKTYPLYLSGSRVLPPPKVLIWLENSGITSFVTPDMELDVIPCVMTKCDVTYEAFFRNGRPRVVTVGLSFVEIIQIGNNWKYVSRDNVDRAWLGSYNQEAQNGVRPGRTASGIKTGDFSNPISEAIAPIRKLAGGRSIG